MARLATQHLANVGERVAVVLLQKIHSGAPVPSFRVTRPQLDHRIEKLDGKLEVLLLGRRLDPADEKIAGVAAGWHPLRPNLPAHEYRAKSAQART